MTLDNRKPQRVWHYFEEISAIPRGSGNQEQIGAYCEHFAKQHHLGFFRDAAGNVLIRKPASAGYEAKEGIVLQGHLDMVCVAEEGVFHDFLKDGIELCADGDKVFARGTTLGADDGIAMAYGLAILESETIPHPELEVLFTADEEIGLLGASAFDSKMLKSSRLINLDSEEEGVLTVSCAGGTRALCKLPVVRTKSRGTAFLLTIEGLQGGHSGMEIDKGRINALKLLGHILKELQISQEVHLAKVEGGSKENAIPAVSKAVFCIPSQQREEFFHSFEKIREQIKKEWLAAEPEICIQIEETALPPEMFSGKVTKDVIVLLDQCPNGVQKKNLELDNMVQTSLNAGVLTTTDQGVELFYSIRSSVASEKEELKRKLVSFMETLSGETQFMAEYPAWEYRPDSALREQAVKAYEKVYKEKAKICGIHAGLECGIFLGQKDLDCISFGPTLHNVHTPQEHLYVDSVERTWEFLLELLKMQ